MSTPASMHTRISGRRLLKSCEQLPYALLGRRSHGVAKAYGPVLKPDTTGITNLALITCIQGSYHLNILVSMTFWANEKSHALHKQ